ncbi:MAG: efflux transporter outer membrane subunit [Gemmataceae bacterium]|nr:efflux transporter outer membrane subunit [Gemmataceae bacterium]
MDDLTTSPQRWAPIALLRRLLKPGPRRLALIGTLALSFTGCTTLSEYVHNGFKVGPNYKRPPAPVAEQWIDATDVRVRSEPTDGSCWWTIFGDPVLDSLVQGAYQQNLTLREAGFRVLAQRAQLGIAIGELFPQSQYMNGDYTRVNLSGVVANRVGAPELYYSQWDFGFGMSWELDFWGRFRRSIEAARDELDASVETYDDALVSLIGDVATNYVTLRTLQQQIAYARENVRLQTISLNIATARFKGGQASEMDVNQAQSDLSNTQSLIPQLEIQARQATNRLCVLLGIPPEDLAAKLGQAPIPTTPPEVVVGIPADLLRRRPDIRRREREAAAQSAQIGVAEAALYPAFTINGTIGWSAEEFKDLFSGQAGRGVISPSFQWNLLNYGRLLNNIRLQDARFQALVAQYQQTVLQANAEVENGIIRFLRSQQQARFLATAVAAEQKAVKDAIAQYEGGLTDFNRVAVIQERLVTRQNSYAVAQGEIALGMVQVYRALGGGWQLRCQPCDGAAPPFVAPGTETGEQLPHPQPVPDEKEKNAAKD